VYIEKVRKPKKGDNLLEYCSLELDQPQGSKGQVLVSIIKSLLNLSRLVIANLLPSNNQDFFSQLLFVSLVHCAKSSTSHLLEEII
jgi:hypothetical protein